MADSIHVLFEQDASDRDLPSPYMEKLFGKFEGIILSVSVQTRDKSLYTLNHLLQLIIDHALHVHPPYRKLNDKFETWLALK